MGRIDIRNVPGEHLTIIDQIAREQELSREAYLREVISKLVREKMLYTQSEKFAQVVEQATEVVAENNKLIERLVKENVFNE